MRKEGKTYIMQPMNKMNLLYQRFREVTGYIGRRRIAVLAAASAFWTFLSIVPVLMVMVSILPYTSITQEQILDVVERLVPGVLNTILRVILADVYKSSVAVLSLTILLAIWSAGMGFSFIIQGMELIQRVNKLPNYFIRRFRGILYAVVLIFVMLMYIILMGFGRLLVSTVEDHFPEVHSFIMFLLRFRFLVVVALLTLSFVSIYRWSTRVRPSFRSSLPGALLAAIGWCVFSSVFSVWVNRGTFGIYGSLATVVIAMLWLYYCMYILFLGACFNRALLRIGPQMEQSAGLRLQKAFIGKNLHILHRKNDPSPMRRKEEP